MLETYEWFTVKLTLGMPEKMADNSRLYLDRLFLDYHVLGIDRHEYLPLGVYLGVVNTTDPICGVSRL